jgi:ABC-type Mn2+/Zn2+ transport system permease subunit
MFDLEFMRLAFAAGIYAGLAAGVVIVSAADGLGVDLFAFLFGSILTVLSRAACRPSPAGRRSGAPGASV